MRKACAIALTYLVLAACNSAKNTPLPQNLDKMESIKPAMEKLTPEERELAGGYIMRHALGAKMKGIFGGVEGPGIPDGMTIGKAIEEQRKFIADQKQKQLALKAALQAKREAALKSMKEAVTVTLVSKRIKPKYSSSGILMDENFVVTFGYKNNTAKDIAGVKGYISVRDIFGDKLSEFGVSNDNTIAAGKSITWTGFRTVKYAVGDNKDRKLAELDDSKYKVVWEPRVIVFSDGSKLELPDGNGG